MRSGARGGQQRENRQDRRRKDIVTGHRNAEQRPLYLIAFDDRGVHDLGPQGVDGRDCGTVAGAGLRTLPPMLLHPDMENGDTPARYEGQRG